MSTAADLDRVQGLVNRVQRLGSVQPGDVIHAQQWNDLIGAVMEIAQTLLAPQDATVPPHDHPDQVKVTWLDPSLRNLVERGPLATGDGPSTLLDLENRVTALRTDVDGLKTTTAAIQTRLLELNTRDLDRDSSFTELKRNVTAILNRGDSTADLRTALSDMQANVNRAIQLGSSLRIGKDPVDMNQIDQRLRSVEDLRKGMTAANGSVLDAKTIENQITVVRNDVVTQKQLDAALLAHETKLPDDTLKSIRDSVTDVVRGDLNTSVGTLKQDILDQAAAKLKDVDTLVNARVDTRLQTGLDAALGGVRDDISKSAASAVDTAVATAKKDAGGLADDVRQTLGKRIDDLDGGITARVVDEVGKVVPARLSQIEGTANAASASATSALQLAQSQATLIQQTQTGIAQLALQTSKDISGLQDSTTKELSKRDADIQRVDKRVADLDAGIETRIDKRITPRVQTLQDTLSASLQKTATDAANVAVSGAATSLRTEMKGIAQDEATAARDGLVRDINAGKVKLTTAAKAGKVAPA